MPEKLSTEQRKVYAQQCHDEFLKIAEVSRDNLKNFNSWWEADVIPIPGKVKIDDRLITLELHTNGAVTCKAYKLNEAEKQAIRALFANTSVEVKI